MSPLSANTLFHFTDSFENVVSILTHEFRPRYSLEDFGMVLSDGAEPHERATPMVCFCDIPLSQTAKHMRTYGNYAIGLSKEWGVSKGISPVLYVAAGSLVSQTLRAVFINNVMNEASGFPNLVRLKWFLKEYEGDLYRRGIAHAQVRFYDEREWRYVPTSGTGMMSLTKEDFLDPVRLAESHQRLVVPPLQFEPSNIRFLIVARENEVLPMIHRVHEIKAKYSEDERAILCSRIHRAELIMEDF